MIGISRRRPQPTAGLKVNLRRSNQSTTNLPSVSFGIDWLLLVMWLKKKTLIRLNYRAECSEMRHRRGTLLQFEAKCSASASVPLGETCQINIPPHVCPWWDSSGLSKEQPPLGQFRVSSNQVSLIFFFSLHGDEILPEFHPPLPLSSQLHFKHFPFSHFCC